MDTKPKDNYFKMKKPAAIAFFIGLGVVLAALIAVVTLDTLKIRDLEARVNTVGELTQMGPGGKNRGEFQQGGTPPDMNGEMPEGEAPELPAEMLENTTEDKSTNKSTTKSSKKTNEG